MLNGISLTLSLELYVLYLLGILNCSKLYFCGLHIPSDFIRNGDTESYSHYVNQCFNNVNFTHINYFIWEAGIVHGFAKCRLKVTVAGFKPTVSYLCNLGQAASPL